MADTIYVVNLPGNLELRVELAGRPVDFEIVFKGIGSVKFHRPQGGAGVEGKVEVDSALLRENVTGTTHRWRVSKKPAATRLASSADADGSIEFSDPGM